jgi:galactokinase
MRIKSRAPGRICLFGEHQDYMDLPVIAAAIDLTIDIEGQVSEGDHIRLDLEDLQQQVEFNSRNIRYTADRDYLKSTVNVLARQKMFCPRHIQAVIRGNIPIQAGTSSSSALVVAWTGFLLQAARLTGELPTPAGEIGELAYLAEVAEFGESGGRMDQYTSALGGIVHLDFYRSIKATPLPSHQAVKEFVLGDSRQPKDTQKTLKRIRTGQEQGLRELSQHLPFPHAHHLTLEEARPHFRKISKEWRPYLEAVVTNHNITQKAREELSKASPDTGEIANLMNRHHRILRGQLNISTPKIEGMIEGAMAAGALSAKINGSGEGGCMFAFCPGKQPAVAEAIARAGGTPHIINIGPGLQIETS